MKEITNETEMRNRVPGWGVDMDPNDQPGYPRLATPERRLAPHLADMPFQTPKWKVHQSLERPRMTAAFGASVRPRGISGLLRNFAYSNYSEGKLRHWFILMAADRVDVMEGVAADLLHGHIPNYFAESGWKVDLKERPDIFVKRSIKLAVGVGLLAGGLVWLTRPRKR